MPAKPKKKPGMAGYGAVAKAAAAAARAHAAELGNKKAWGDEEIHQARVLCKKLRAAVHLGRGLVRRGERREWNLRIREAARSLAAARDRAMLHGWIGQAAELAPHDCQTGVRAMAGKLGDTYDGRVSATVRRRVVALFTDVGRDWPAAWGRIKATPREGLRHMREDMEEEARDALVEGEAEAWHRWRRRVKYCAYQLEWLALAAGKKPGARYLWLRKLGSALGKVNDMHNLTRWAGGQKSRSNGGKYLREWSRAAGDQWAKRAHRLARDGKLV